jgi:putative ABC transport system permease protein
LIVSYCLGVVLTFITVAVSSFRVSRLNIVAAIRGTDDAQGREARRKTRWVWVALGVPALVIPPLGLWLLLRKGFGLPNAWVWGPLGIVAGIASVVFAKPAGSLFLFNLGGSLLPLAVAGLARYYHAPSRPTWTLVGAYLLAFWLLPIDYSKLILGESLEGAFEMFVLSGIMIVIGFTLVIIFNARLLSTIFRGAGGNGWAYTVPALLAGTAVASAAVGLAVGDAAGLGQLFFLPAALMALAAVLSFAAARFPRFGPALKMGVAYPLASSFRTGMTIAMFSLIVFSLVVMSTLNANFSAIFASDDARGGWDVVATTGRNNPVPDLKRALDDEGSFNTAQISGLAHSTAPDGASEVRQVGQGEEWSSFPVRAGNDAFFAVNQAKLDMRAAGYASDRDVYEAVRTQPNLAIIDALVLGEGGFGPQPDFKVEGIKAGQDEFDPIQIEVRDPVTGKSSTITVIGVFSSQIPQRVISGLYTSEATYAQVYGAPEYRTSYLRLTSGVDAEDAAKGIEAALLTRGAQAFSVQQVIDEQQGQVLGFRRILQAYLGLGLFVGIAALGVIAFRSVVERRQQIGMLRAIGYPRGTVALTFLLESSFIALMGILSGVVGAAILSRNLMTSGDITDGAGDGFTFFIPWGEVSVLVLIAYGAALVLTWWPSRGAARTPIAEALRYE